MGVAVLIFAAGQVRPRVIFGGGGAVGCLGLILLGLAIRAWASGCAGKHTWEAKIEAPRLTTGGPYAYVRNPIYLGCVPLGLGFAGILGDPWLLGLHLAVCVLLYAVIVPAEEEFLRGKFGEAYARYAAAVPRIWPRGRPWPEAEPARWETSALLDQLRLAGWLVALGGGFHLAALLRG